MNILTFTTLYPNAAQPYHGIFVENRLRQLVASGRVHATVVAPVPWFPIRARVFGRFAKFAEVPGNETRFGIEVLHPRYPVVPKVGMTLAPFLLYTWIRPFIRRMMRSGANIDLIDAHYIYPDGIAAVMLGRHFKIPVVVTARGTDINLIPRYALPRRMIRWTADKAQGLVSVSQAIKDEMVRIGIDSARVHVLRNGVDLDAFRPVDRAAARKRLDVEPPMLLSIGHLIARKGHDIVIRALSLLPDVTLLVVGEGPEEGALRRLADSLDLHHRVRFLGTIPHERLHEIYSAADALVLASDREGLPNVLLEAMASGTPVVAARVWGTPEVVTSQAAGILIPERTPEATAAAVQTLLADPPSRAETRAHAEHFGWSEIAEGQFELFRCVVESWTER